MTDVWIARLQAAAAGVTDLEPDPAFAGRAVELLSILHPATGRDLRTALALVDNPLSGLVWGVRATRLHDDTPAQRAVRIRNMAASRIPPVRAAASAVRSISAALMWAGSPQVPWLPSLATDSVERTPRAPGDP